MSFENLEEKIIEWAEKRNILSESNPQSQLLKTVEEVGELVSAFNKNDAGQIVDAIGDVLVCLIVFNRLYFADAGDYSKMPMELFLLEAYNQIKNRTGEMKGGLFVKTEEN